jgi:ferredoxin-NADP reductase
MIASQSYTIKFIKKINVAKDTYSFYFKRPNGFEFIAGQYNRWTLPITATDGRGSSRFFTISSPPSEKDTLVVTTKIIQSDFKKELVKLHENQEIKIFGPMGQFVLDENNLDENIFIAEDLGITPFYGMLMEAAATNSNKLLTLFVSFSVPEEMVFLDELTKLTQEHQNSKVVYTITKPQESKKMWNGETGKITEKLIKKYTKDLTKSIFYVVGPPHMVENTQKLLEDMNIPNEHIRTEQFSGY